jgi:hypothetical protein
MSNNQPEYILNVDLYDFSPNDDPRPSQSRAFVGITEALETQKHPPLYRLRDRGREEMMREPTAQFCIVRLFDAATQEIVTETYIYAHC